MPRAGIGTYAVYDGVAHTEHEGFVGAFRSALDTTKDLAVGTSLGQHVMAGYKFLMRYHMPGDQIYIFGFSRGAYTARFLAEMLDDVGLLPHGNEEMVDFAWQIFAQWQQRRGATVPRTDYKFWEYFQKRRDEKMYATATRLGVSLEGFKAAFSRDVRPVRFLGLFDTVNSVPQFEVPWMTRNVLFPYTARSSAREIRHAVSIDERRVNFRADLIYQSMKRHAKPGSAAAAAAADADAAKALAVKRSNTEALEERSHNITPGQIVDEVWFAGNHGDVGGGWATSDDDMAFSHVPLVWMVRAAARAGISFNQDRLRALGITLDEASDVEDAEPTSPASGTKAGDVVVAAVEARTQDMLRRQVHDSLTSPELNWHERLRWNIAEYIPFRRMELQGRRWVPIRLPLPAGDTRDIPLGAHIHGSVLARLRDNALYRPPNLILSGGMQHASHGALEFNADDWEDISEPGSDFFERVYVRRGYKDA